MLGSPLPNLPALRRQVTEPSPGKYEPVNHPNHIIDADNLRKLSGKKSVAAIRRWASRQGIRCGDGATGPWTTLEALNFALGVPTSTAANDSYGGDIL